MYITLLQKRPDIKIFSQLRDQFTYFWRRGCEKWSNSDRKHQNHGNACFLGRIFREKPRLRTVRVLLDSPALLLRCRFCVGALQITPDWNFHDQSHFCGFPDKIMPRIYSSVTPDWTWNYSKTMIFEDKSESASCQWPLWVRNPTSPPTHAITVTQDSPI